MRCDKVGKKHAEEEINQYKEELKRFIKLGGNKVYCVLRGVSRSGMTRYIDFYTFVPNTKEEIKRGYGKIAKFYLTYKMGVVLDYPIRTGNGLSDYGLKVEGCGTDMGFELVYNLGRVLYPKGDGKTITGRNGSTEPETDGGYLIKHEWL